MDSNSNKKMEELININIEETIENDYGEYIEYAENINTLIYTGRVISVLTVLILAIILLINKIKKKNANKEILIVLVIFIMLTVVSFFIREMPV